MNSVRSKMLGPLAHADLLTAVAGVVIRMILAVPWAGLEAVSIALLGTLFLLGLTWRNIKRAV